MDEALEFDVGFGGDGLDLGEREFAGEGDAMGAEAGGETGSASIGDAHLSARVDLKIGGDLADEGEDGEILDDDGVGSGFGDGGDAPGGFGEFVIEDEGIEGDEAADAAGVEGPEDFGEFGELEADLGAGGEVLEAEVDGIGAGFDGRAELGPMSGGAHDFGFAAADHDLVPG